MHFVNRLYRFGLLPFLIPVLLAGFLSTSNQASGQEILGGHVHDATSGQSLAGVNIFWLGSTIGTTTDTAGHFSLMRKNENTPLVFSMVGYSPDTVSVSGGSEFHVALQPGTLLTEMEIEGRRESASLIQPINTVTIDQHELTRGACCNLSESFETNADVDVEFTDAVSGAQQLRMLGLDGRYVQLLTENRPGIRGLALPYGLTYIPGTWMSSIQITKGPGSVVNGYEAMSGQLNVEYIRPENAGKLNLNAYGSVLGRFEANAHGGVKVGEHASMGWFGHGHWVTRQNDHNQDGFLDLPEANMFIGMNRWSLDGRGNVHGELGAEYIHQDLFGGQLDSRDADISVLYSNPTSVRRAKVWSKIGWISPVREARSSGLVLQGTWHQQQSRYGNRYEYAGEQRTIHANFINDFPIGGTEAHLIRAGGSLLLDDLSEELSNPMASDANPDAQIWERMEVVPGVFGEYNLELRDWSVVAGIRADYHNLLGWFATPRLHVRKCWNEQTTLRLSGGRGLRTVNPVLEFNNWMNSARVFERDSGLLSESAWNTGGGLMQVFSLGEREWSVRLDYFYTAFEDRVVADLDADANAIVIRQAEGFSRSHAGQVELEGEMAKGLSLRLAYKYEDVRAQTAGELRPEAFVPRWRSLISMGYQTPKKDWQADATLQLTGPARLPLDFEDTESPVFPQLLAQITRNFTQWSVYVGSENITNFSQHHAIRGANDPFGSDFDAAGLWGPVMGRNVYAGVKFTLN